MDMQATVPRNHEGTKHTKSRRTFGEAFVEYVFVRFVHSCVSRLSSNVATTGAWSLVPTSFCTGHDVARAASASLANT